MKDTGQAILNAVPSEVAQVQKQQINDNKQHYDQKVGLIR